MLLVCVWIFVGVVVVTWLLSVITREYSWVDRIWSLVPVAYVAVFAGGAGFTDARLDLMLGLVVLWGARLTFNYARKGGYAPGGEDYRWGVLRSKLEPWQYQLFNFFFISLYQNVILLLITLPAYTALQHRSPIGVGDVIAAVLFLVFLVGETIADQQQWTFQQRKRTLAAQGHQPAARFLEGGLFRYSRHPNFFCEQAQWWMIFVFGAVAAGSPWQWTVAGAVLLTLLFVGSTRFTESISLGKYPEYADYRHRVSAQIPWRQRAPRPSSAP